MKYWILIIFLFFSCKGTDNSIRLIHNVGFTQGTSYSIKYISLEDFHHNFDSLFLIIDNSLSTYNPNSLISRLNSGDTLIKLDDHFIRVFKAAYEISSESNGYFDFTVAPLVEAWGFGLEDPKEIDSIAIVKLLDKIGYSDLYLKGDSLLSNPELKIIDFNAIAQGYTIDIISEFLDSNFVDNYLIEIGGEVKTKGLNSRKNKWRIGIDKPKLEPDITDRFQVILELQSKSLATSGNYRNYYEKDDKFYTHIINPITGYPVQQSLLSVSVISDDCMTADAYATTFMVMGIQKTKEFLSEKTNLDAFLIFANEDGSLESWSTKGFESLVIK